MTKEEREKEESQFIKWFSEIHKKDGLLVGGKGANLGEMTNIKIPVPPGFVITTKAYDIFIEKIKQQITEIVNSIDFENTRDLEEKTKQIRDLIIKTEMPKQVEEEILESYEDLGIDEGSKESLKKASGDALEILKLGQESIFVAVRSSATTEDLEDASFAGQQDSFLNIKGKTKLIETIKKCFASLFTARATYYREKKGFGGEKAKLAVVVQKMIDSKKSGVIFSENPIKENNNIVIEAVFGLGQGIVSGKINPDHYEVERKNGEIVEKEIEDKKIAITRNSQGDNETVELTPEKSNSQVLDNHEIKKLAVQALELEEHYKVAQDIEFAIDDSGIYIVQTRAVTTKFKAEQRGEIKGEILLQGIPASQGIASGKVKVIHDLNELDKIKKGDILVTKMTNPDMVVTMQKSAAIVTDIGGLTAHASIVGREMGIPTIVGTKKATQIFRDGQEITVDGTNGKIYSGKSETKLVEIKPIIRTKTKIKVMVDLPEAAERAVKTQCKDVGLMRLEGIIASGGKHPEYFVKENKLNEYSDLLAQGISKIAEHFESVWIRTSDIRSDEYKTLEGAPQEKEPNPMLGFHGIRQDIKQPEILKAELKAIKKAAEKFPNKKLSKRNCKINTNI